MNLAETILFSDDGATFGFVEPPHAPRVLPAPPEPIVVDGESVLFSATCCMVLAYELLHPSRHPAEAAKAYRVSLHEQTARAPSAERGWFKRDALPGKALALIAKSPDGVPIEMLCSLGLGDVKSVRTAVKSLLGRGLVFEVVGVWPRLWKATEAGKAAKV